MVDKTTHDDYIRIYKELVNQIERKEDMIEAMTKYIARHCKKISPICKKSKRGESNFKCNYRRCIRCVREYFEEGF